MRMKNIITLGLPPRSVFGHFTGHVLGVDSLALKLTLLFVGLASN